MLRISLGRSIVRILSYLSLLSASLFWGSTNAHITLRSDLEEDGVVERHEAQDLGATSSTDEKAGFEADSARHRETV